MDLVGRNYQNQLYKAELQVVHSRNSIGLGKVLAEDVEWMGDDQHIKGFHLALDQPRILHR